LNWEAISASANIVAAIAVVASLVFLGIQIRLNSKQISENSKYIEASVYYSTIEPFLSWYSLLAQNADAAAVWHKVTNSEALDDIEKIRPLADAFMRDEQGWTRLRHRKVVQWGVAYAAGAWGLLQGLAYVSTLLHWPDQLSEARWSCATDRSSDRAGDCAVSR
jgi:hypothetical protein